MTTGETADEARVGLPGDVASLVRLSAALAAEDTAAVESELASAASADAPRRVDETIVQSCLFLGFPAALEAAARWRSLRGSAPAERDPLAEPARAEERRQRGVELCRRIYGSAYESLRANVADASPPLDRLMVELGYGSVLGRPGLEPMHRELCIVAILAVQGRDRQLYSHLRGALRTGAPARWVDAALEVGLARVDAETAIRLRRVWVEVRGPGDGAGRRIDVH